MFVIGNLLLAAAPAVHGLFQLAWLVLFVRILFSWIRPNPGAGFVRTVVNGVYALTDPVLERTRRALPFLNAGGLDLSPIALFLALGVVDQFATSTLIDLGYAMT